WRLCIISRTLPLPWRPAGSPTSGFAKASRRPWFGNRQWLSVGLPRRSPWQGAVWQDRTPTLVGSCFQPSVMGWVWQVRLLFLRRSLAHWQLGVGPGCKKALLNWQGGLIPRWLGLSLI